MSNYWDKRAANRMYEDMKTAEEAAEDIRKLYGRASRYIQLQGENIFEAFRRQTGLTEDEARYLLTHAKSPKDVQMVIEFAKQIQDPAKRQQLLNWIKASATQSRLARLAELQESIDKLLPLLYMRELQYHQNVYQKIIQDAYLHKIFDIQQYSGYGKYVTPMDDKRIDKLMRERWLGSNYSSRLWGNTNRLAEAVRDELLVSFLTGRPQKEAWQAIDAEFHKGAHAARRLVRTESNYLANQGHAEAYKDSDVEKYIYVATLDMKTSEICRSLDGRTFFVKNAQPGRNYPPMHPWCRSTTIAWIPDALLAKMKRTARDPVTGKNYTVPANMTYNEWYKKYVLKNEQTALSEGNKTDIITGGTSGALDPDSEAAEEHASRYYDLVRSMTTDVQKIAQTTGLPIEEVQQIKDYIFYDKHDLGDGKPRRFDPSYFMSQSWQRLTEGNPLPHDITLLNHEKLERKLVNEGMTQHDAHIKASKEYNYNKEATLYHDSLKKHQKE